MNAQAEVWAEDGKGRSPSGAKKRGGIPPVAFIVVLTVLIVLDMLSQPGVTRPAAFLVVNYATKTAIALAVIGVGLRNLLRMKLPSVWRGAILTFVAVVVFWLGVWFAKGHLSDAVTMLLSPQFSAPSWMFVLLVPVVIVANADGQVTAAFRSIPPIVPIGLLVALSVVNHFADLHLNLTTLGTACAFMLCSQQEASWFGARLWRAGFCLLIAVCMYVLGTRTYFAAFVLLGFSFVYTRKMSRGYSILLAIAFLTTPIIFSYITAQYGDYLAWLDRDFFQDTRSFLFTELIEDMSQTEIFTGRGLDGTYYSPYFHMLQETGNVFGSDRFIRYSSEISWLNILLKFGLIGLIPYLFTILYPVFMRGVVRAGDVSPEGMRRFLPHMLLIFIAEMPNTMNGTYFCFYLALGTLLALHPRLRRRSEGAPQVQHISHVRRN